MKPAFSSSVAFARAAKLYQNILWMVTEATPEKVHATHIARMLVYANAQGEVVLRIQVQVGDAYTGKGRTVQRRSGCIHIPHLEMPILCAA